MEEPVQLDTLVCEGERAAHAERSSVLHKEPENNAIVVGNRRSGSALTPYHLLCTSSSTKTIHQPYKLCDTPLGLLSRGF